jgi:hypothetical protein
VGRVLLRCSEYLLILKGLKIIFGAGFIRHWYCIKQPVSVHGFLERGENMTKAVTTSQKVAL